MPLLEDPSCPGTYFNHRWNNDQYSNFRTWIHFYAERVSEAYQETDLAKSLEAWQKIFGPDFKKPDKDIGEALLTKSIVAAPAERAPDEEFIEEKGFPVGGNQMVRIHGTVDRKPGFRHGNLRALRTVGKHRQLRFRISTDVSEPFELYWKVRNTGKEAEQLGALRGQILRDSGSRTRTESTSYSGRHYVEAYIVKGGRLVARDRHEVVIE